jgi:hypothetical protein
MKRAANEPHVITLARALAAARRRADYRDHTVTEYTALGITQLETHLEREVGR